MDTTDKNYLPGAKIWKSNAHIGEENEGTITVNKRDLTVFTSNNDISVPWLYDTFNNGNTKVETVRGSTSSTVYSSGAQYISLNDVINNFLVAYVGEGKLIPSVKRTDIMFHAKRGLQEFSYDTLKSIKSQELTIPENLSLIIPQDYVNYVKLSYIDGNGVKHTIYPTQLTSSPYYTPIQDKHGKPVQDNFSDNIEGTSLTNDRWQAMNPSNITGFWPVDTSNPDIFMYDWWGEPGGPWGWYGQRYGGDPVNMQVNGWFNIDERRGTFNFSSDLEGKLILLE